MYTLWSFLTKILFLHSLVTPCAKLSICMMNYIANGWM